MKARISQINRNASGYDAVIELDTGKSRVLKFPETVTKAEIRQGVRDYLKEKVSEQGRLPELRELVGVEIEVV